ncbi:hypothetical protein [Nocardioides sp. GCM10030258]|uniref:hypothetical protein n=1 Tax=unclassified Nocardioides TaxID=2615069 RepID=UPI0036243BB3
MDESSAVPAREVEPWSRRQRIACGVSAAALVATGYFAVDQVREYHDHQVRSDSQKEAVETAERVALGLATISPKTAREDIDALAAQGTPEFAKQVRSNLDDQVDLIAANKVSSSGEVRSSGVVELKDEEATIAIAMVTEVKNSATKDKADERSYRMTVSLERKEDGPWLASEVVFVQ